MSALELIEDVNVKTGNPKEVGYSGLLPLGVPASTFKRKFQPTGQSNFTPTNNICKINLNTSGFIDLSQGMLRFKVTNNSPNALKIDGSAHSFINKLVVYGPNMENLETIERYNVLASVMSDIQLGREYRSSIGNALAGYSTFELEKYDPENQDEGIANGKYRYFHIPLLSGFLGLSNKYLPAQFITGTGVQIELTFAPANQAFFSDNEAHVPDYQISEVYYEAPVIDFKGNFYSEFKGILDLNGVKWHTTNFQTTVADYSSAGSDNTVLTVALRHRSLKSIIAVFQQNGRTKNNLPKTSYHPLASTINNPDGTVNKTIGGSYQFKIGSVLYPPEPVNYNLNSDSLNTSELMSEILKSVASVHSIKATSVLNKFNLSRAGCLALDFENYPHNSFEVESGLNTITNNLPMQLIATTPGPTTDAEGSVNNTGSCIMFCLHDVIYALTPSGFIIKSN